MSAIYKILGSSVFRYLLLIGVSAWGGHFLFERGPGLVSRMCSIDTLEKRNAALSAELDDQRERHAADLAEQAEARRKIEADHAAFRRRAIIENSKLKKALENDETAKDWARVALPDSVKRVREYAPD